LLNKLGQKGVRIFSYDPIDFHHPENSLAKKLDYKSSMRACPDFSKADRVLSLDSDFLGHREPNSSVNTKQFMPGRKVLAPSDAKKMNRLYSVESDLSITGGVADHRLRLSSSSVEAFSALFLSKLLILSGSEDSPLFNHLTSLSKGMEKHDNWASECAKDLFENSSSSIVVAGSHLPDPVHLLRESALPLKSPRVPNPRASVPGLASSRFIGLSRWMSGRTIRRVEAGH